MLLEIAIGDAYGAGFEYADEGTIRARNDLSRYVRHKSHGIEAGHYTDDTQMSIAVAEAILSGQAWTQEMLARRFVEVFKRDPRKGYAGSFYGFLARIRDGAQFLAEIHGDSEKSGAAMRAGPIGVFPTVEEVIEKATVQAAITHNTPNGINSAVAAALMTHYFIYDLGPKEHLGRWLSRHVEGDWARTWHGKVGSKGWMSVRAAVTAVVGSSSMSELLRRSVGYTGDVDTVAAIALAAGSCSKEVSQDLPKVLAEGLENGKYGREYLIELDRRLFRLLK
jgi:ADP-ribosylglycohydrolase